MSEWDNDMKEISRISFDPFLTQEQKNFFIAKIELKMTAEELKESDGKGHGYYD
jgi:hypothetical protein|tara:strand:- start:297 stop:458 length:162 start_codon:yes stop_codon:yes gene_type:complete